MRTVCSIFTKALDNYVRRNIRSTYCITSHIYDICNKHIEYFPRIIAIISMIMILKIVCSPRFWV